MTTSKLTESREAYHKLQREQELAEAYPRLQAEADEAARQAEAKAQAEIVRGRLDTALAELEAARPNRDEAIRELVEFFKGAAMLCQDFLDQQSQVGNLCHNLAYWQIESKPSTGKVDKWSHLVKKEDIERLRKTLLHDYDIKSITSYANHDLSNLAASVLSLLGDLGLLNSATNSGQQQAGWHQQSDGSWTVK